MKAKIFKTHEVPAILGGRKTRFSEVCEGVPEGNYHPLHVNIARDRKVGFANLDLANPYDYSVDIIPKHQPGDIIYAREAWAYDLSGADFCYKSDTDNPIYLDENWKWQSPATMPREAARIFLEVTGVRVQRVQDITHEEAKQEGNDPMPHRDEFSGVEDSFRDAFRFMFNRENGPKGHTWERNPWIFAYSFNQIKKP